MPVRYLFGSEDPVFADHLDSSIWAIQNTRHARVVLLNGEKHLMEIDCPERVAQECIDFFESAKTDWSAEEDESKTAFAAPQVDAGASNEPDPDLAGSWTCAFDGPMGRTEIGLVFDLDGASLGGLLYRVLLVLSLVVNECMAVGAHGP
ncbi:MAG: alpha/beta hydrolase [Atopobiaceae bacterium]|nr:alpha/beta hydrolase [Atopobiaceae bacterium]